MSKLAVLGSVTATLFGTPARPQKNEIIVTGAREASKDLPTPNVAILRRADAVAATLVVSTDAGDYFERLQALRKALGKIESRSANSRGVSLAYAKNGNVLLFTLENTEAAISSAGPPESSRATLLLRTPVVQSDKIETAMARIYAFRNNLPRLPRIEYELNPVPDLTMAGPNQHRKTLIEEIVADVRKVTDALGAGYAARIEGLEQRMIWRRANELEMSFFIPYRMEIRPTGAG